jgi:hypothetical protein
MPPEPAEIEERKEGVRPTSAPDFLVILSAGNLDGESLGMAALIARGAFVACASPAAFPVGFLPNQRTLRRCSPPVHQLGAMFAQPMRIDAASRLAQSPPSASLPDILYSSRGREPPVTGWDFYAPAQSRGLGASAAPRCGRWGLMAMDAGRTLVGQTHNYFGRAWRVRGQRSLHTYRKPPGAPLSFTQREGQALALCVAGSGASRLVCHKASGASSKKKERQPRYTSHENNSSPDLAHERQAWRNLKRASIPKGP